MVKSSRNLFFVFMAIFSSLALANTVVSDDAIVCTIRSECGEGGMSLRLDTTVQWIETLDVGKGFGFFTVPNCDFEIDKARTALARLRMHAQQLKEDGVCKSVIDTVSR